MAAQCVGVKFLLLVTVSASSQVCVEHPLSHCATPSLPAVPEDETNLLQLTKSVQAAAIQSSAKDIPSNKHDAEHGNKPDLYGTKGAAEERMQMSAPSKKMVSEDRKENRVAGYRSDAEVLKICGTVIGTVFLGWLLYWVAAARDESFAGYKSTHLVLLLLSFAVCSWGMNVVNKALVDALNAPCLVTCAQMMMTVIGTVVFAWRRIGGTKDQMLKWLIIPLIFSGMLVSSFYTYKYLTLSMLIVVRNMGPIVTLPIESVVMPPDKRPVITMQVLFSLSVVLVSTLIYCVGIDTNVAGIGTALLNMMLCIADRVMQRRLLTTECRGLSTETCMLLNNSVGMIPALLLAFWFGEIASAKASQWFSSLNTVLLILSGLIGTGICYFALAVQREIAATSFMMLQNAVRMAVVLVGVVVFYDPIGSPFQMVGLLLSFSGTLWYGKCAIENAQAAKADMGGKASPTCAPGSVPEVKAQVPRGI